ncbi:PREDICTED: pentatricopeptide repeat domain-containing protein 3, mitochondrial-like isoform X2 [Amphimedon queenslandica]|uniref:Small ribosomal subunit protein mS39 n=1 Tax=Amphimedon queenslandica TaxID=400682 RepID=A0A1X7VL34_AMPQE|nr:PREDICTED: pentatricopeptide repeat domain-containing protein 3, mitochondrial-like isoform X2 [Amphimedon queenslandica]|eukprot:XP_003383913.2 PREDICTED: pentatricopeptide repeat domain-containing protein 3, mitochondrial-like isoform X2 [Amphimedon queenslandica]
MGGAYNNLWARPLAHGDMIVASRLHLSKRYVCTTCALLQRQTEPPEAEPQIPLVPKKRDPNAVLKALASTVTPLKQPFILGRTPADPLAPSSRKQLVEFIMAREAGKMAAMDIINSNPKVFDAYKPFPDLMTGGKSETKTGQDKLKVLIKKNDVRALDVYNSLKKGGESIDLETENSLLALLAYNGQGNTIIEGGDSPSEENMVTVENEGAAESDPMRRKKKSTFPSVPRSVWSVDNSATKFFNEMKQKDGGSYGAMIQGLVKFKDFGKALSMYNEAREKALQMGVSTYNDVLQCIISDWDIEDHWGKTESVLSEMSNGPSPVQPNITTCNLLLKVASKTGGSSRSLSMEIMRELFHLGLKPTLTTLLQLLKNFVARNDCTVLPDITEYIENNQDILDIQDPVDMQFFTAAMSAARMLRDADVAIRLKNLANRDHWFLVDHPPFFFNNYFATIASCSRLSLLKDEFDAIVPSIYIPQSWLYTIIFKHCQMFNAPDVGLFFWKNLMKCKIRFNDPMVLVRAVGAFSMNTDPEQCSEYLEAIDQVWKKLMFLQEPPSQFMITVTIKLHLLCGGISEAWKHFETFEKYKITPSYLALSGLLNAHAEASDTPQTLKLLDMLIEYGYFLPPNVMQNIFAKVDISIENKSRIMRSFKQNASQMKQEYQSNTELEAHDDTKGEDNKKSEPTTNEIV